MAYFYYTLTAILLYLLSDWILNQIERSIGKRLKYRSVIFFAIILTLSMVSFNFIEKIVAEPPQTTAAPAAETAPATETAPIPAVPAPAAN